MFLQLEKGWKTIALDLQGRNRVTDIENGLVDTSRAKDRMGRVGREALTYIHYHV